MSGDQKDRRKYTYAEEVFSVIFKDCELTVIDPTNKKTSRITRHTDGAGYAFNTYGPDSGGYHWFFNDMNSATRKACELLVKARPPKQDPCKDIEDFFDGLDVD